MKLIVLRVNYMWCDHSISERNIFIWFMNSSGFSTCGICFVWFIPTISIDGRWFWYWAAIRVFSGFLFPVMIKILLFNFFRQCSMFAFVYPVLWQAYRYLEWVLSLCVDSKQIIISFSLTLSWLKQDLVNFSLIVRLFTFIL